MRLKFAAIPSVHVGSTVINGSFAKIAAIAVIAVFAAICANLANLAIYTVIYIVGIVNWGKLHKLPQNNKIVMIMAIVIESPYSLVGLISKYGGFQSVGLYIQFQW
jgi:hypothetical protein